MPRMNSKLRFILLADFFVCLFNYSFAQDTITDHRQPCIIFPMPMYEKKWQQSIGFVSTTTPEDITEEVRVRAPAGDYHVLRRLSPKFNLDGRLLFQVVQNHISAGLKYSTRLGRHTYLSLGDDVGFWFGKLMVGGFDSKGKGWTNYPNLTFGVRTNNNLLLSLKSEIIINTSFDFDNGGYTIERDADFFNGYAFTIAIEQPFYHTKNFTLGFTAMYTDFYWMMWSLFETFDRKIFYPQITVGFII
jgi:hypothetical protein